MNLWSKRQGERAENNKERERAENSKENKVVTQHSGRVDSLIQLLGR